VGFGQIRRSLPLPIKRYKTINFGLMVGPFVVGGFNSKTVFYSIMQDPVLHNLVVMRFKGCFVRVRLCPKVVKLLRMVLLLFYNTFRARGILLSLEEVIFFTRGTFLTIRDDSLFGGGNFVSH